MVPLFRGLGYSIVVICCVSELYYAVICGWSFFYLFAGMQSELPWISCEGEDHWHTPNCYTKEVGISCRRDYSNNSKCATVACTWYNGTCTDMKDYCIEHGYATGSDSGTTLEKVNYNCIYINGSVTGNQCKTTLN